MTDDLIAKSACCCTSPKSMTKRKLFIFERRFELDPTDMIKTGHCLSCNAAGDGLSFEIMTFEYRRSDARRVSKDHPEVSRISSIESLGIKAVCSRCGQTHMKWQPPYPFSPSLACPRRECASLSVAKKDLKLSFRNFPDENIAVYECLSCKEPFFAVADLEDAAVH